QKVAFDYALRHGFSHCVVLHGDDQGDLRDLLPLLDAGEHRRYDCLLGSRFMRGARLEGYSLFRTLGNQALNALFTAGTRRGVLDLGSGLNCYAARYLRTRDYLRYGDDLTFVYHSLLGIFAGGHPYRYFPIRWRETDQVSNVRLAHQAWQTMRILAGYVFARK